MTDGSGPPASVLKRVTFFLVIGAILFLLFDRFGPYQSGRGYRPRPVETVMPKFLSKQGSAATRSAISASSLVVTR